MLSNKKIYLYLLYLQGFLLSAILCAALLLWQYPQYALQWAWLFIISLLLQNLSALSFFAWIYHQGFKKPPPTFLSPFWRQLSQHFHELNKRHFNKKRQIARFYKQFYQVANAWSDAVLIYKESGEIEWSNPKAQYLFRIQWPEQAGKLITEVIAHPTFQKYVEKHDYRQPLELETPSNKRKVLSLYVHRFGKKRNRYVLLARDVTRMYYLDRTRKDFIANASHELRTPLTVIHGFLESFLDEPEVCSDWVPYFDLMQKQTVRMESIVRDLLTLSSIEATKNVEKTVINMQAVLNNLLEDAKRLSGDHQHDLHLIISDSVEFKSNEKLLYMAMSNLVFNAVHYTEAKTRIDIRWQQQTHKAVFQVKDYGEGIPAHHIPRLTERFYRVDKGRSREKGGTGLGLAIVKHAAHQLGGKLHIHSSVGKGSVFTLAFGRWTL